MANARDSLKGNAYPQKRQPSLNEQPPVVAHFQFFNQPVPIQAPAGAPQLNMRINARSPANALLANAQRGGNAYDPERRNGFHLDPHAYF